MNAELVHKLREFIEMETRSGSMEPSLVTPLYVYRMWGGSVDLRAIEEAMNHSLEKGERVEGQGRKVFSP